MLSRTAYDILESIRQQTNEPDIGCVILSMIREYVSKSLDAQSREFIPENAKMTSGSFAKEPEDVKE